jgi:uncharacterized protein (TIGR03066 family)
MNTLRFLAAGAMFCALTVGVRGDDKKADNAKLLVGAWEVVKADKGTVKVGEGIEFTKDGKMKLTPKVGEKDETIEGTYTIEGDKFTFMVKVGDDIRKQTLTIKKISETEMSITDEEGKAVELKRKK